MALISDDIYYKEVETIPAFREPMVLLTSQPHHSAEISVHPTQLNPQQEIRLPWNPEYDVWHDFWFSPTAHARAVIDQMSLLEEFLLRGDCWAIVPVSAARVIAKQGKMKVCKLEDGPSPRIIYYLQSQRSCREPVRAFLSCLRESLLQNPDIECLL